MKQRFIVTGMSCGHCERAVTQAIAAIDPLARVHVDLASGTVEVESTQAREALARAIADEGYAVA
jgi:copper chaperone